MTSSKESVRLADPDERPGADVVIYDGECRFCTGQIVRLARWDRAGRLAYVSLHDPRVSQRYPDLTRDQLMEQLYVVNGRGDRWGGAAAFRYLSRHLPAMWVFAPCLHIPGSLPFWQWCYRQVAKRRYRGGRTAACDDGTCDVHFR
ncbi:MAG: thiol-disulfide oxidoreductase DCC family protein [Pirellulaceae bacterium]